MRAYIRAVREYNDALKDGRIAGPNADEIVSVLTEYTFIKDANIHRSITPAAIDPDGRMSLDGLRNDLAFFKEQKLIQDPGITVERIIDTSFAERAAKELGPYMPREDIARRPSLRPLPLRERAARTFNKELWVRGSETLDRLPHPSQLVDDSLHALSRKGRGHIHRSCAYCLLSPLRQGEHHHRVVAAHRRRH